MANKDDGSGKGERLYRVRHIICPHCQGNDVALYEPEHTCICQTCHQWFPAPPALPCPEAEQWPATVKPPAVYAAQPAWEIYTPPGWEEHAMKLRKLEPVQGEAVGAWQPAEAELEKMEITLEDGTGLKTHFKFDRTELEGQEFRLVFKLDRFEGPPDPPDNLHTVTITPTEVPRVAEEVEQTHIGQETNLRYGIDVPVAEPVFFDCRAVRPDAVVQPGKERTPLDKDSCPRCGRYVDAENDKLPDGRLCCRNCARICTAEQLITDDDDYEWVV